MALRGSGVFVSSSKIDLLSRCVYANGVSKGVAVYIQPSQPATVSDLIFVGNTISGKDDYFHALLLLAYIQKTILTIADSFFLDNKAVYLMRTLDTEGEIISQGNTFSTSYGSVGTAGHVTMREEENTFYTELERTYPNAFDPHFVCLFHGRRTCRSRPHKYLSIVYSMFLLGRMSL